MAGMERYGSFPVTQQSPSTTNVTPKDGTLGGQSVKLSPMQRLSGALSDAASAVKSFFAGLKPETISYQPKVSQSEAQKVAMHAANIIVSYLMTRERGEYANPVILQGRIEQFVKTCEKNGDIDGAQILRDCCFQHGVDPASLTKGLPGLGDGLMNLYAYEFGERSSMVTYMHAKTDGDGTGQTKPKGHYEKMDARITHAFGSLESLLNEATTRPVKNDSGLLGPCMSPVPPIQERISTATQMMSTLIHQFEEVAADDADEQQRIVKDLAAKLRDKPSPSDIAKDAVKAELDNPRFEEGFKNALSRLGKPQLDDLLNRLADLSKAAVQGSQEKTDADLLHKIAQDIRTPGH